MEAVWWDGFVHVLDAVGRRGEEGLPWGGGGGGGVVVGAGICLPAFGSRYEGFSLNKGFGNGYRGGSGGGGGHCCSIDHHQSHSCDDEEDKR